jgi:hypothetical protein
MPMLGDGLTLADSDGDALEEGEMDDDGEILSDEDGLRLPLGETE